MLVHVVGSADAFNSSGRGHSCYWIDGAGDGPLMIDFGATALMRLNQEGLDPRTLQTLLITHLHGDHFGGLPFLIIDGLYNRFRETPLHLIGPIGFAEKLETLLDITYGAAAKLAHFNHTIRELAPGDEMISGGARIAAFAASHMDAPEQPLCVRITSKGGKSVAFSGDTELCEGLFSAAKGADLLIAECTTLGPPAGRHITWEDWSRSFDRVGSKRLLLTHLGADVRAKISELQAPEHLGLRFAEDGMMLQV